MASHTTPSRVPGTGSVYGGNSSGLQPYEDAWEQWRPNRGGGHKEALTALKLAFKAAAAARPADEATPGAKEAARAKKKQLFTQDRAETKQVPIEEGGPSGATFTIGADLDPDQEEALVKFLRANKDVFAWEPKQLVGVPRG